MPLLNPVSRLKFALTVGVLLATASLLVSGHVVAATTLAQTASEGKTLFEGKCIGCHTIGGGHLIGPDLQGVTQRRDLTWIKEFITDPQKKIASGDPIATQLLAENNNIQMPNLALSPTEVESLVAYLENPEGTKQTQGSAPAQAAFASDPRIGKQFFIGAKRLQNGGPPCIACHSVEGSAALGGGSLGPDLTHVFQRYGDSGLTSALQTIPFPTMQTIFLSKPLTPEEQSNLHAYFLMVDQQTPALPQPWIILYLGSGLVGAGLLFGVMFFIWPRQRQSLSDALRQKPSNDLAQTPK